jgi:anti-sigma factor RsiW
MDSCERTRQLNAYHDGELSPEDSRLLEAHLAQCAACARELQRLRGISRFLAGASMPGVPVEVVERLHENVAVVRERSVVRMAEMLTAAAAVVLVACGGWVWHDLGESTSHAATASPWEQAAVTLRVETSASEPQQLAQWIVEDLSQENGND